MQIHVDTALSTINHLSKAYQLDGRWNAARQFLAQGIVLTGETSENRLLRADLQNRLSDIMWKQGNTDQAEALLNTAKTIAEVYNDQLVLADSLYHLGEIAYIRHFIIGIDQSDSAHQLHQQALVLREVANDTVGIIQSLSRIGVLYERSREYDAALDYYQKSVQLAEKTNHQHVMTRALNHIGVYHRRKNDLATALTYFQRALSINQASGNAELLLFALDLVGETLYELHHDFDETQNYYRQALKIAEQLDFKLAIIRTLFLWASLYVDNNHTERAIEIYQRIADIAAPIGYEILLKSARDQITQLQTQ